MRAFGDVKVNAAAGEDRKADGNHQHGQADRGQKELQPPQTRVETENKIEHRAAPVSGEHVREMFAKDERRGLDAIYGLGRLPYG
jgi:hypothetical protein